VDTNDISEAEQTINESVIKALNHKIRRTLLLELYKHGWGGYSELSKTLNIKAGSFYHHMRLLEESGLVKQLEDKLYEITPQGAQASEFIRGSFSPLEENRFSTILKIYSPVSSRINSIPRISLLILLLIYILGILWLATEHQTSIIGFFIVPLDDLQVSTIYSIIFTSVGLIGLYAYFLTIYRRVLPQIMLASHILVPESFFIGVVALLSLTPSLDIYASIPSTIAIVFTFIYQLISISYYIHVLQQAKIRLLGSVLIILLLQQYYHLLVLFLFV
jgi:DNA-binding transcriptional ArsR family regulator